MAEPHLMRGWDTLHTRQAKQADRTFSRGPHQSTGGFGSAAHLQQENRASRVSVAQICVSEKQKPRTLPRRMLGSSPAITRKCGCETRLNLNCPIVVDLVSTLRTCSAELYLVFSRLFCLINSRSYLNEPGDGGHARSWPLEHRLGGGSGPFTEP